MPHLEDRGRESGANADMTEESIPVTKDYVCPLCGSADVEGDGLVTGIDGEPLEHCRCGSCHSEFTFCYAVASAFVNADRRSPTRCPDFLPRS